MQNTVTELTLEQKGIVERLALENKMGTLSDLAEQWGVEPKLVIRYYVDCRNGGKRPERRFVRQAEAPPAFNPTPEQRTLIRRLAERGMEDRLEGLAVKWGVPLPALRQVFDQFQERELKAEVRNQEPLLHEPPTNPRVDPQVVMGPSAELPPELQAEADAMPTLPYNWVLINARVSRGLSLKAIANAAGIYSGDYRKIEEGRMNPTREQAAKICLFLNLPLDSTFAVAALPKMLEDGPVRTLSVLALSRARKRLNLSDLVSQVQDATGVLVSRATVSALERGALKRPFSEADMRAITAIAAYFGLSVEAVTSHIPSTAIESVAKRTAALHHSLKTTVAQLGTGVDSDPILKLQAGGESA